MCLARPASTKPFRLVGRDLFRSVWEQHFDPKTGELGQVGVDALPHRRGAVNPGEEHVQGFVVVADGVYPVGSSGSHHP
jgi:hypothetical protein